MVTADLLRACVIFSLPFFPSLPYLLVASMALESLTLVWGPAKDASLPHLVPTTHLTHANSLNLIGVYGPWPIASVVFALMAQMAEFLSRAVPALSGLASNQDALALWVNSLTFVFSAFMIYTLTIPGSRPRAGRLDLGEVKRDLVEGLTFIRDDRQVRPWLLGIAFTFTAAGGVFSLGVGFVKNVLGGGDTGFAFLIGFLGLGMIAGLLSVGIIVKRVPKDVVFSSSIVLLGFCLVGLASLNALGPAIPVAAALGFFGGGAYSTGYALIHEKTRDDLRGRTFSAAYTVIRIGTLVGLGFFPLFAGAIGDNTLSLPFATLDLPGSRVTLWLAGLVATGGGLLSMRAIDRRGRDRSPRKRTDDGYFIAFEGGEGAGKSTQMAAFCEWLSSRGADVVVTREPGGTAIGTRIRDLLLDKDADEMDPRSEALLYAADRAQHVAQVILPALEAGKVVVSDRFVDSSLAYQGIARGLGMDEIYQISDWATGGVLPDLVFYLRLDHQDGLNRAGAKQDRLESAGDDFHAQVSRAYLELANRFPDRFVVIDGAGTKEKVHEEIVRAYGEHLAKKPSSASAPREIGPPGPPVPR